MSENDIKLLKNRSNIQESQNFKTYNQIKQVEQLIEITENKKDDKHLLIPKINELFDYLENSNETSSINTKSKYLICIKTMNYGSLKDDCFNIRLYGLEGKSKEKQITIINKSKNLHEFEFDFFNIGQLIGISLKWFQGFYIYFFLKLKFLKYDFL